MLSSSSKKVHYGKRQVLEESVKVKKEQHKPRNGSFIKLLIMFCAVLIIATSYYVGNLYTQVTVNVIPKAIKFDHSHKAEIKEVASINVANTPDPHTINVVPVNFEYTASRSIENLETEFLSEESKGAVTIFNTGATSQLLTEGTRFINPKTMKMYVMVGEKIILKGGTKTAPATAVVNVEAAEPGQEFNTKDTLKIFAWYDKKDPRNTTQYAQPVTGIIGGFMGDKPLLTETDKQTLTDELHKELSFVLKEKATSLSLSGVFKIDNPTSLTYEEPIVNTLLKTPKISAHGTYQIYLMKQQDWFEYAKNNSGLQNDTIKDVQVIKDSVKPYPEFSLSLIDGVQKISQNASTIFSINPNKQALQNAIAGEKISKLGNVFKTPLLNIASASISVQPFWLTKIPQDISKINVIVK